MIKIAYYYTGNQEYIDKLKNYDLTILIDNENYVSELLKFGVKIKNTKYDCDIYDILLSETDNINIKARKKVVIGTGTKKRVQYIEKFDIHKILEPIRKNDIKFSIIIPNYNNGEWINRTIESVLNQTYQNWEMYIIDDMSTDNSAEVVKSYKDKRITLIENEIKLYNGGSRNIGILKAKKSNPDGYLIFIDSDDWLADNNVLQNLNSFIVDEDLITLEYDHFMNGKRSTAGRNSYKNIDDLFMTQGCMCAVWTKCFKVSVAPLFSFNTLMEDRVYHYRLINRINSYANLGLVTHIWNKDNAKSVTTKKEQRYGSEIQTPIEWDSCAYRHIADQLELLKELTSPVWIDFIKKKIEKCKSKISMGIYLQY